MRIAVVDDERPARSELKYLVEQCEPDAEIAEADGSEEFLAMLENETLMCVCGYQSGRHERHYAGIHDKEKAAGHADHLCHCVPGIRGKGF